MSVRHNCINLLWPTGDSIPHLCMTCGSSEVSVWECEAFGLCAPFVKGSIDALGVTDCQHCNGYRSNGMYCDFEKVGGTTYKCKFCPQTTSTEHIHKIRVVCTGQKTVPEETQPEDDTVAPKGNKVQRFLHL